jgi:hypothetical protein
MPWIFMRISRPDAYRSSFSLSTEMDAVLDFIYVLTTILFFALMLAFVAACDRLGRGADVERGPKEQQ